MSLNVLTNKGFIKSSSLPQYKEDLHILLDTNLYKQYKPSENTKSTRKLKLSLITGEEVYINPHRKIVGLTYTSGMIKNDLETLPANEFKVDDYLYTSYKEVNYFPENRHINLADYSNAPIRDKHRIYYLSRNLYKLFNELPFSIINLFKYLNGKTVKQEIKEDIEKYLKEQKVDITSEEALTEYSQTLISQNTSNILAEVSINKRLMDYLIVSMLRGKVEHTLIKESFSSPIILKSISYKFNKDNERHQKMLDDLLLFLRGIEVDFEEKDYEHYISISFVCDPLVSYYETFVSSNFKELKKYSTRGCNYFIRTLYKYSNNSFYSNYETYLFLKEYAFYNKIVLGYDKNTNPTYEFPIYSYILEDDLYFSSVTDILVLEDKDGNLIGYLSRITNLKYENTVGDDDLEGSVKLIA